MASNINTNSLEIARYWESLLREFIIKNDLEDEFNKFVEENKEH